MGNARQAASYYCTRMGFKPVGYRGLETGHRDYASHVIQQDKIFFVFQSPLQPDEVEMNAHISRHGDGVKDVAFTVDNCRLIFQVSIHRQDSHLPVQKAVERGAKVVREPWTDKDRDGEVVMASIATVREGSRIIDRLID